MKRHFNAAFPAAVLILVALAQIWRAHTLDQSPWKGGGFGMFATGDTPFHRFLKCRVQTADGEVAAVDAPDHVKRLLTETRVAPTEENLRMLAEALALEKTVRRKTPLSVAGGATASEVARSVALKFLEPGSTIPDHYELVETTSVRLELWRVEFDSETLTDRARLVRMVTVPTRRR